MSILSSSGVVRRNLYYGLRLTFLILCVFSIRDMQRPDGVTGASRRYSVPPAWPRPKPAPPAPEPYIKPKPHVKPKPSVKQTAVKPAEVLTSTPAAEPQLPTESITPKGQEPVAQPAAPSNPSDQQYHWRTQGSVGFVSDKNLAPGFLQEVSIWCENGEQIDFMIVEGTRFLDKEGAPSDQKRLTVHDRIFLIYDIYLVGGGNRKNVARVIRIIPS